jgi:hypothetical protein
MWASDVILALDRVSRGKATDQDDLGLLREAASVLEAASQEREQPNGPTSAGSIAFAERALDIAEGLTLGHEGDAALALLATVAEILRQVADTQGSERMDEAVAFFEALGRQQLAATQSVLNSQQEAPWTAGPTMPSFS